MYLAPALLTLCLLLACGDDDAGAHDADASPDAVDGAPATAMTFHTRVGLRAASVPFFAFQDGDAPWQAVEGDGGAC